MHRGLLHVQDVWLVNWVSFSVLVLFVLLGVHLVRDALLIDAELDPVECQHSAALTFWLRLESN
jgi:hypothetical protein